MIKRTNDYFVAPDNGRKCHLIEPAGKEEGDTYEAETLCGVMRVKSSLRYENEKDRRDFCEKCLEIADIEETG